MKQKSRLLAAFSLLMAVTMLIGCVANPTVAPATVAPATGAPATDAPAPAPVKVLYWSTSWFPASQEGRKASVVKFNQEYKGKIEVEYIQGESSARKQYIEGGIAAGGGIACVMEYDARVMDWYSKGYVNDLRPYITPEIKAYMTDDQWIARTAPDGAIPLSGTTLAEMNFLYYNPAHFEAAGIKPATLDNPWSWDTLFENAKLLTVDINGKQLGEAGFDKANVAHWGYISGLDGEKVIQNGMDYAQMAMGAPIIRQENGKWGWFLDDKGAKAYERYLTSVLAGISPEAAIGMNGDTMNQLFAEGKVSMLLRATFVRPALVSNFPDFKFAAMPMPMNPDDKMFYVAGGEGLVMTKYCEQPEAAAEFIFWMMKPENNAIFVFGNGMTPANIGALDVEPYASDRDWDIIRSYLKTGVTYITPYNPNLQEFYDTVVAPTLMEVGAGTMSFADANKLIQEQAILMLNK